GQRLLSENFQRGIVGDFIVFDDAAMAMVGVFAEANIGDDQQAQFRLANGFDGALHNAVFSQRTCTSRVFRFRESEKDHPGDAEVLDFAAIFGNAVGRLLEYAGHGTDLLSDAAAWADKHWIDKACGGEARFANQSA